MRCCRAGGFAVHVLLYTRRCAVIERDRVWLGCPGEDSDDKGMQTWEACADYGEVLRDLLAQHSGPVGVAVVVCHGGFVEEVEMCAYSCHDAKFCQRIGGPV